MNSNTIPEYYKELISLIRNNDGNGLKSFIKKASKNHIPLNFNQIVMNENGTKVAYPFDEALTKSISIIKVIMDYTDDHKLFLNVNEKNVKCETPVSITFQTGYLEKVLLLIEYSNRHDIILNINDKYKNGHNLLSLIIESPFNSYICMKLLKTLVDYANEHNIIININEKDVNGNNPLALAIINNKIDMIEMLIEYANQHNIIIDINEKNENNDSPLLLAIKGKNTEIFQMIMKYAEAHHIILNIKDNDIKDYSEIKSDILKLLTNYANTHGIPLNINDIRFYSDYNNIKGIICKNEVEKLKLLIQKVEEKNLILNINERYSDFNSPLSLAIKNDNIEMVKIFINYAECHNIGLKITNDDRKYNSKINSEIIYLIEQYNKNRTRKSSTSNNKMKNSSNFISNSCQTSGHYDQLPKYEEGTSSQNQAPPLSHSQSEIMTTLLSQPPDVLVSILSQLQTNIQLLQSQSHSSQKPSPPPQSLSSLRPSAPPIYTNDSSANGDLPSYNEITDS